MADGVTVEVKGLDELRKQLINLGSVAGTKAMRQSMFAATKPLLAQAKANESRSSRSGALRESLRRSFRIGKSKGVFSEGGSTFTISVGPKTKSRTAIALYNLVYRPKRPRRGIYHGHFIEFGTKTGTQARHHLEHALLSSQVQCTFGLANELRKRIERALRTKRPVND